MSRAHPTKQQFEVIKQKLSGTYGFAYLNCDGYLITAQVAVHKRKLVIDVYVDGYMKGKWAQFVDSIDKLPDESRKFWRPVKYGPTPAQIKKDEKNFGKRECKKLAWHKVSISALPSWPTPGGFIAHIKKHCESIAVLTSEEHDAQLAEKNAAADQEKVAK